MQFQQHSVSHVNHYWLHSKFNINSTMLIKQIELSIAINVWQFELWKSSNAHQPMPIKWCKWSNCMSANTQWMRISDCERISTTNATHTWCTTAKATTLAATTAQQQNDAYILVQVALVHLSCAYLSCSTSTSPLSAPPSMFTLSSFYSPPPPV